MPLEEFEMYINRIKAMNDFQDDIHNVCYKFCQSNRMGEEAEIWMPTMVCTVVDLLGRIIGTDADLASEWISYWLWELNFGESYEDGCVEDANGENIKLKTVEDLYNFLLSLNE